MTLSGATTHYVYVVQRVMCQEPVTKSVDISVGIYNGKLNPSFISGRSYVAAIEKTD